MNEPGDLLLGKASPYPERYSPQLLRGIPRATARRELGVMEDVPLPFAGTDRWTAYELSWCGPGGKPRVGIGEIEIPCTSPAMVESKSLKLYLNSLNQHIFPSTDVLIATVEADLGQIVGDRVRLCVYGIDEYARQDLNTPLGECLDGLSLSEVPVELSADTLGCGPGGPVTELLYTHLFKSNCPVTGQPDWATLCLAYRGAPIIRRGLLSYILSFRQHQAFHENCVERLFVDISSRCAPEALSVAAFFTRRGGIDINPIRSAGELAPIVALRTGRQ